MTNPMPTNAPVKTGGLFAILLLLGCLLAEMVFQGRDTEVNPVVIPALDGSIR